jgi:serine/threonine-protein kinase
MKKWQLAAAIVVACLASSLGIASGAHALTGGPWDWNNTATLDCLDSNPQRVVYTLTCNGGPFQQWSHTEGRLGDEIVNLATNLCLDSNPFGDVYTLTCNGGTFQRWIVTHTGSFGWEIRNTATGLCLYSDFLGEVYARPCNGRNLQRWH